MVVRKFLELVWWGNNKSMHFKTSLMKNWHSSATLNMEEIMCNKTMKMHRKTQDLGYELVPARDAYKFKVFAVVVWDRERKPSLPNSDERHNYGWGGDLVLDWSSAHDLFVNIKYK